MAGCQTGSDEWRIHMIGVEDFLISGLIGCRGLQRGTFVS